MSESKLKRSTAESDESFAEKLLDIAKVGSSLLTTSTRSLSDPKVDTTLIVRGGAGVSGTIMELLELLAALGRCLFILTHSVPRAYKKCGFEKCVCRIVCLIFFDPFFFYG